MHPLLLAATVLVAGQPNALSARPTPRPAELDPFLWPELESVVAEAARAERDPKRGPGNAIEILEAEERRRGSTRLRLSLELRIAGIALRQRFLEERRFSEPLRAAQALSTYSRLDLAEPGLRAALDAALNARRSAAEARGEALEDPELVIEAAVLTRSRAIEASKLEEALRAALLEGAGARLQSAPPKAARFLVVVGARPASTTDGLRSVTVTLDLQEVEQGQTIWRHSLFRTSAAPSLDAAMDAGLEWLARIGGRDLLFRFLARGAVPALTQLGSSTRGRAHGHDHPGAGHGRHEHGVGHP